MNPNPPPPPERQPEMPWLIREGIGAIVALVLTMVSAIVIYLATVSAWAPSPDAFNRFKELLAIVTGLLGTILGYYFGRAPAELNAAAARGTAGASEQKAQAATTAATDAKVKAAETKAVATAAVNSAARTLESLLPAGAPEGVERGGHDPLHRALAELRDARADLDRL